MAFKSRSVTILSEANCASATIGSLPRAPLTAALMLCKKRFLQSINAAVSGARGKDPIVADAQFASDRIVTERDLNAIFNILSCADHVNEPGSGIHIASGASVALVPAAHARVPLRIRSIEERGWNGWIDRDGAVGLIRRRHNFCQEAGITGNLTVVIEHFYPIISFEAQHTVSSKSFEFQDGVRTTGRRNRIHPGDNRSIITRPFELCWIGSAYSSSDMHFNTIESVLKSTIAARGRKNAGLRARRRRHRGGGQAS